MNKFSIARTAPIPSKTAPKASAARISHMNMQETSSVLIDVVACSSRQVRRPLTTAASVAQVAPTAELSTRLVYAADEEPGHREEDQEGDDAGAQQAPAFPAAACSSSSSETVGASFGFSRARIIT